MNIPFAGIYTGESLPRRVVKSSDRMLPTETPIVNRNMPSLPDNDNK